MWRGPRFNKQYVGGILAGIGVGTLLGVALGTEGGWLLTKLGRWPVQITALMLLPIGQSLVMKGQVEDEGA